MKEIKQDMIIDEMSKSIIAVAERLAMELSVEKITVRKILQELGITNRVFYNRFHNIDEVLNIVYEKTVEKIRESIKTDFNPDGDFFEQVIEIVVKTLKLSYQNKMQFSQFVFENDSMSNGNYEWWKAEITKLIEFGKNKGYLKEVNSEIMSYSIWCFIRGYNADALGRGLPMEKAISDFKYSFGVLLDGMKKQ